MIREIVFSWQGWVLWYTTAGIGYMVNQKRSARPDSSPPPPEHHEPEAPIYEPMMAANVEDGVHDIRSTTQSTKPGWMS